MSYRTPLGRARGLGAAGVGPHEWWRQRLTSIALIPLALWLAPFFARTPQLNHEEVVAWIGTPSNSLVLLSFLVLVFYHAALGLQVVIEDYVHAEWAKLLSLVGMKLVFFFLALASLYATLRIAITD